MCYRYRFCLFLRFFHYILKLVRQCGTYYCAIWASLPETLEPLKLVEPRHFYWSDNANPGKSPFVYLCVMSIAFVYFYDFPIGFDCVLFLRFSHWVWLCVISTIFPLGLTVCCFYDFPIGFACVLFLRFSHWVWLCVISTIFPLGLTVCYFLFLFCFSFYWLIWHTLVN